jgi:hypothetical protein
MLDFFLTLPMEISILSIASLISLERLPLFDPIEKYTLLISFINERQKNIFS